MHAVLFGLILLLLVLLAIQTYLSLDDYWAGIKLYRSLDGDFYEHMYANNVFNFCFACVVLIVDVSAIVWLLITVSSQ